MEQSAEAGRGHPYGRGRQDRQGTGCLQGGTDCDLGMGRLQRRRDIQGGWNSQRKREEAIRTEEAAKIAKELDAFKAELIVTWEWVGYSGDVTFKADGTVSGSGKRPSVRKRPPRSPRNWMPSRRN